MRSGLIMEGGGMTGVFTAGVIDVLMRNNIKFDGAIGVSAGGIFGSNIKSGQIGRAIRFNKKYCQDPRYCSVRSFLLTGDIFGADFCYRQLTYELDPFDHKAFENDPMEFWCAATELETGKAVYHRCRNGLLEDITWLRASASVPVLSRRVEIYDKSYLDGGITDSIPIRFFEKQGYTHNVIILTKPYGYQMRPANYMFWARLWYQKKYPLFLEAIRHRHIKYNRTMDYIKQKERAGEVVVVRPSHQCEAGLIEHDPALLQKTYDDGVRQCELALDKIKKLLSEF